jgi:hypothetical protein
MDEKISLESIAVYGDSYAEKVLKEFFSGKDKITGPEILSLCNVQQINLFVISELFKAWRSETQKQRSAYFDYENHEVKEALAAFMTVLSNHISIDKTHFSPLLKKAVSQTLMAIFDPYDFFSMIITGMNNKLEVIPFKEEIKYLKINKAPLERMLQKVEEKNVTEMSGNEAFAILDQILEEVNFTPEDLDDYIAKFSQVIPLNPDSFYVAKPQEFKPVPKERPEVHEHTRTIIQEDRTVTRENNVVVEQKRIFVQEKTTEPASLNDRHSNGKQQALADSFRKISKIKDNLSINQKFMFTKILFYGDFESFSRAIDDLDQMTTMEQAMTYLEKHSSTWDRESKEFHEFMELVEMRFAG